MRRILNLAIKEFLTLLKDPKSRVILIVPPILQTLVFGYAATLDLSQVRFAVYDQDGGQAARELVAGFDGSPTFQRVATINHLRQAEEMIAAERVLMVVHVGPGFTADLLKGRQAPVQLLIDGRNSNTALVAQSYARTIVQRFASGWAAARGQRGPPARVVTRAWYNPTLNSRWFIIPGIVGLILLVVTMLVTALSVAREREQGTFDQLLVTPMRPVEILVGKALPGLLLGLLEATAIVLIAVLWFQIPLRADLGTLYLGIALFLLAAVGVGLMISALAVTLQQALLGAFLFMVPAVILSGFATPIANMPVAVQYLTLVDPLRYFLVIVRSSFLEGTPMYLLVDQYWPLLVIGLATLAMAGWLFRRRMY